MSSHYFQVKINIKKTKYMTTCNLKHNIALMYVCSFFFIYIDSGDTNKMSDSIKALYTPLNRIKKSLRNSEEPETLTGDPRDH